MRAGTRLVPRIICLKTSSFLQDPGQHIPWVSRDTRCFKQKQREVLGCKGQPVDRPNECSPLICNVGKPTDCKREEIL